MIKVENNTAIRTPLPSFLRGLSQESLYDLSWTDPALGVQDVAWWPEEQDWAELQEGERYTEEVLTIDQERKVVVSTRQAEPDPDYIPPPPELKTVFSVLEFRERFTQAEQVAIKQLSLTDIEVGLVYDSFLSASFIDVMDPRIEQGLALYVQKELITQERKAEIMSAEEVHV